jgi:hypothetical protein
MNNNYGYPNQNFNYQQNKYQTMPLNNNNKNQYQQNPNYYPNQNINSSQNSNPISNQNYNSMDYSPYNERNMNIKWRNIMKIDIDALRSTNDLTPLNNYIDNMIYSNISEEEIGSVPEGNIAKLIKLYQIIIDNVLKNQNQLESKIEYLNDENSRLINENENKDASLRENKDLITKFKKQKHNDDKVLLTYKNVIQNMGKLRKKTDINVSINNSHVIKNENEGEFFCKYCTGVKFYSEEDLQRHMKKAHQINVKIKSQREDSNIEKKIDDLKKQFETYLKNFQDGNMRNYQEQRKLESDNYEKQMEKMERNFKDTLKDLKDFYIQSTLNQGNVKTTNLYIPQSGYTEKIIEKNNDNNNNNDEIIKLLKDNINEMNKRMEEQNEKNANALREMKDLYESQLNDLREENRRLRDNKKNITVNVNNREEEKKNDFRSKPNIIEEKKPIKKIDKKTNFYGGELIDDNDDDDIILKKNIINQMSDISKIINVVTNKKTDIINKDIEKNEFPKKPILNTNKRNLEQLEDEKKEISPNENKLRAKQQLIVNTLTINEFYNKYKSRDQNTFKNPNEENYYQIIDNKENQNNIINTINQSLVKSQISVEENFNYNNIDQILENKNKEELEGLIINTYNNLEQMSNNDILKHYVDSIKQCVNINHFDEERKKIAVSQINILPKQLGFTNNFNELNNIKMAQSVLLNKEESKIEESKLNDNINTNKNNNENENEIEDI